MQYNEEQILEQFKPMIIDCIKKYHGKYDDDIFQECCIALIKAYRQYNPDTNIKFITFAHTCIRNKILTINRYRQFRKHSDLPILKAKEYNNLLELIDMLPDTHRYIILNRYGFEDKKTLQIIAEDLKLPYHQVRSQLKQALSILRAKI